MTNAEPPSFVPQVRRRDGRRGWQAATWLAVAFGSLATLYIGPQLLSWDLDAGADQVQAFSKLSSIIAVVSSAMLGGYIVGLRLTSARAQSDSAQIQTEFLATRVVPALDRLIEALERLPRADSPMPSRAATESTPEPRVDHAVRARAAIAGRRWAEASARLEDLLTAEPASPVGAMLVGTLERAKAEAAVEVRGALDAARSIGDALRVMDLRNDLASLLAAEPRLALDKDLVGWLMAKVRRGLADLPVQPDVVTLANRVADEFAATAEGASLRRALPVLRRTVGLCPRCAKPYRGVDDACPECLAGVVEG